MCLRTITSFILVVTVASIQFPIDLPEGTNLTEAVANTIFGNRGPVKHFEARSHAEISSVDGCKVIRVYLPVTKVRNHIAGVSFEKPLSQTGWGRTIMFQGKFSPGFQFGESGELFGLCAGDCNDPHDFNAILSWDKNQTLDLNSAYEEPPPPTSPPFPPPPTPLPPSPPKFVPDQWFTVKMKINMNTNPVSNDGKIHVKLNEIDVLKKDKLKFIQQKHQKISSFLFNVRINLGMKRMANTNQFVEFKNFNIE